MLAGRTGEIGRRLVFNIVMLLDLDRVENKCQRFEIGVCNIYNANRV